MKNDIGAWCEILVLQYLLRFNCELMRYRYRIVNLGEIDLIVRFGNTLHFVEVKYRSKCLYPEKEYRIAQLRRSVLVSEYFLYECDESLRDLDVQFDLFMICDKTHECFCIRDICIDH